MQQINRAESNRHDVASTLPPHQSSITRGVPRSFLAEYPQFQTLALSPKRFRNWPAWEPTVLIWAITERKLHASWWTCSLISESRALLAYVLYDQAQIESLFASFAKSGSSEEAKANESRSELLQEAQSEAISVRKQGKGNSFMVASYVLAGVEDSNKDTADAIPLHSLVANYGSTACGADLASFSYRSLVTESAQAGDAKAAERWFRIYASKYASAPYEWDAEGDRRTAANDWPTAADAYEKAAAGSSVYDYDYCYAAEDNYFQTNTNGDAVLSDGRKCVDASVRDTTEDSQKQFQHAMPVVYRAMADVLNSRGVYQQVLEYAKEAIALAPNDALALAVEASIFENLERYTECISAAQAAINASDGKYGMTHFRLGSCYFDLQNWSQAADSFRLAAEADKSDPVSAFNLGLSLQRQGLTTDARVWFQEALRRNPDAELRGKILNVLQ